MDNINKLILFSVLLIFNLNLVLALGVNSPYWQENPLKMYVGETKEVSFPLVNSINEETTEATVSLTKGNEIASIISGEKYTVKPGENNKNIILKIEIPENVKIGDDYVVEFKVLYAPSGEGGNVKLNVEYNVDFPVEIVGKTEAESAQERNPEPIKEEGLDKTKILIIAIILIVLVIIIITLIKLRQRKDNFK